ncbi:MAG TPA: ATP-binding cassette domain-containing protein [Candidatus Binatia bacterium]|nr:ATP-binding cassette domain-containing protein [Candidatus Binatia bacterium]
MLTFADVTLRRGPRTLLEKLGFTIYPGWRAGVVGRNGTGKSTLFAALLGEVQADAGEISRPRNLSVATVAQETPALPDLAIEYTLDGDVELRALEVRLVEAEEKHDLHAISDIHERLNTIGGYAARSRAARLLHGLGFSSEAQLQPVASFSGGWRMRLNLARTLMRRSDLMLLDEPTNHLDLDAVLWLQGWLVTYPGTLLVISHDREFLDAVTTHTLHLHGGGAQLYTGNYSQFERQRAERLTLQSAAHAKQQRQIAHLQSFINRFKAQATKATQAQSRIKQLERMTLVEAVHADSEFSFEFPEPHRLPSPLVRFDDLAAGYPETRHPGESRDPVSFAGHADDKTLGPGFRRGDSAVLRGIKLLVAPGERYGLLGPNGAGKSTLVRTLAGELAPLSGTATRSPHLRVGYFAQHQVEQLDPKASPILHFKRLDARATELELRTFLGGFNFRGDRVFEAIEPFSGGEKARLALALVVYQRPNLLLLDEPTNHLDLDMRHALETALLGYAGAVVLVSHDRHLVSATCDRLLLVAQGACTDFEGDLDDYARWLNERDRSPADPSPGPVRGEAKTSSRERRKAAADDRALRDKVKKLDAQLNTLHVKLTAVEGKLADPATYANGRSADVAGMERELRELRRQVAAIEQQWLAAADALEGSASPP